MVRGLLHGARKKKKVAKVLSNSQKDMKETYKNGAKLVSVAADNINNVQCPDTEDSILGNLDWTLRKKISPGSLALE